MLSCFDTVFPSTLLSNNHMYRASVRPIMSLDFFEKVAISQANHRILNPFSEDKLLLLGEICDVSHPDRALLCRDAVFLLRGSE